MDGETRFRGMHLDKDLLFEGNKVYSADNCVFVTSTVNNFTIDRGNDRGECLIAYIGINEMVVSISVFQPILQRNANTFGLFTCELEAHQAWLKRKLELATLLAAEQTDERVAKALIERYTNYTLEDSDEY